MLAARGDVVVVTLNIGASDGGSNKRDPFRSIGKSSQPGFLDGHAHGLGIGPHETMSNKLLMMVFCRRVPSMTLS